jgi:hydrophobe/amphiphile efflux-1 (HAE1) family protein
MRLTHFFIDRPVFAGVLSMLVLIAGAVAALVLPISEYPEVSPPTVVVTAQYPGANPEVLAETVSSPLEQEITGVEDMIYMNSMAQQDGTLQLSVVFRQGTDVDRAQVQVQNRVSQALSRLPEEVRNYGVTTRKSSPDLTMVVHLFSPDQRYDGLYLRNYALLHVRDALARLPGAGDVQLFGAGDYAMRLWLDPQKLAARSLTAGDVIDAVREQNIQVAAGSIGGQPVSDSVQFQLAVNAQGRLRSEQDFRDIVIKIGADGKVVRLGEIARVQMGAGEYALRSLLDNRSAVAVPVFLQPGANALDLAQSVRETMATLKQSFPQGIDYSIVYDPTVFVKESIHKVIETLLEATLLVVLVVMLFLQKWRAAIIPIIAVPVSIIGTLAAFKAFGYSLNTLTLFGLVLAVGIVVDDAIVVVENVERNIAEGLQPRDAAHRSMDEVGGAIIAISLVLCAVFVPPALVPGFTGQFYRQFALTIAFASVISAFNSLTLSPALAGLLLQGHYERPDRVQRGIDAGLGWLFKPFNRAFAFFSDGYRQWIGRLLRVLTIGMVAYVLLVSLAGGLFLKAPSGFVPAQDKGYVITIVQLPPSASIERTERVVREIADIGMHQPGVIHAVQFPGLSINGFTRCSNAAIVFFTLAAFEDRRSAALSGEAITRALNEKFAAIDQAMIFTLAPPPIQGFGPAGGFKLQIEDRTNAGTDALAAMAQELITKARTNPNFVNVFTDYEINAPQLYADVDRVQAKRLGVPLAGVFQTMQTYLGSYYINDFNEFGRTYRVIAQAEESFRDRPEDMMLLKTRNADGAMIPLGSLLTLRNSYGPTTVQRYNGYPSADIAGTPAPGVSSGQAVAAMTQLARDTLPPGVGFNWTEITYQQVQGSVLGYVFPLCVLLVFLVLAAQYESVALPFAVILIVPMCLLSASLGVMLMHSEINIFTQIGLFVLVGLAAKNSILIVEFARDKQAEGLTAMQAAMEACRLRLRPIVMTSVAFILGVLPLVLASGAGAEIQKAMGSAVFFGMIGVTLFGLFFTPLFYVVLRRGSVQRAARRAVPGPAVLPATESP